MRAACGPLHSSSVVRETIQVLLEAAFPGGAIDVVDRTGGGDHFQVTVVSDRFEGLALVQQHRLVNSTLAGPLADGSIHELRITTRTT
jgi:stress-induced morphogen